MKTMSRINRTGVSLIVMMILFMGQINAQDFKLSNSASQLTVYGTSNLHDWDVKAEKQSGSISLDQSNNVKQLQIVVEAESLKSGKGGMDKNTYKALNTGKHKNITFDMKSLKSISSTGGNNYKVVVSGDLTIAGKTKRTDLEFTMTVASGKVVLKGSKSLNMTEYGVEPPKALLGTITTGDAVKIEFNTTFTR